MQTRIHPTDPADDPDITARPNRYAAPCGLCGDVLAFEHQHGSDDADRHPGQESIETLARLLPRTIETVEGFLMALALGLRLFDPARAAGFDV